MNSTKTAQSVKDYVSRQRGITDLDDQTVRDALNSFYDLYWNAINQYAPKRLTKVLDVDATGGYDLTSISDLGNDRFEVFVLKNGEIDRVLPETHYNGGIDQGYYILETTLYTLNVDTPTIRIVYQKDRSEIADATNLLDHTLEIVKRAEYAMYKFLEMKFYDGKYQFGLSDRSTQEVMQELRQCFSTGPVLTNMRIKY